MCSDRIDLCSCYLEEVLRELHAGGVRIVAGTDAGNPYVYPGHSLHEELALMHAAGLPIDAVSLRGRYLVLP